MNNNKKYKKWSLGLVAPALVLAPIAVVASCSSSGEEKEVYSVSFKQPALSAEVSNKNIKPSKLSKEGFVQETINNKANIFNIDDSSGKVTDDFLRENLVVGEITAKDDEKTASAEVTLNNKNTDGESESATITLIGFKSETDSTPPAETEKFKIRFKAEAEALEGVSDQSVNDFSTREKIKPIVIKNKEKIFEAEEGNLPQDEEWWEEKLTVSGFLLNAPQGLISANMVLDSFDTTDSADESKPTIMGTAIYLKGFRKEGQTVAITEEISTVTLGLNGTFAEVDTSKEINAKWVLDNKHLLFTKGFDLIKEESDIKEVTFTDAGSNKGTLTFKVEANKWCSADGQLGTSEKSFTFTIKGFSESDTKGQLLKYKSSENDPLEINLVDPALSRWTYQEFLINLGSIFNKGFIFKYRKHLLTGDFSKIDSTPSEDFLYEYPAESNLPKRFVKVSPNDSDQTIEITFTILKEKLVGTPAPTSNKEYTIKFNGFR